MGFKSRAKKKQKEASDAKGPSVKSQRRIFWRSSL